MKRLIQIMLLGMVAIIMTGCNLFDLDTEPPKERSAIFIVSPQLMPYNDLFWMTLFEETSDDVYRMYVDEIDGFEYEEGYMYKIKVRITPKEHYFQIADGPLFSYKLEKILLKIKAI